MDPVAVQFFSCLALLLVAVGVILVMVASDWVVLIGGAVVFLFVQAVAAPELPRTIPVPAPALTQETVRRIVREELAKRDAAISAEFARRWPSGQSGPNKKGAL